MPETSIENASPSRFVVVACVPEAPPLNHERSQRLRIKNERDKVDEWPFHIPSQAVAHFRFIYEFIKTRNRSRERKNRDRRGFLNILLRVSGLFACKKYSRWEKRTVQAFRAARWLTWLLYLHSCSLARSLFSTHHVKRIKYLFMQKLCCFIRAFIKIFLPTTLLDLCWRKRI